MTRRRSSPKRASVRPLLLGLIFAATASVCAAAPPQAGGDPGLVVSVVRAGQLCVTDLVQASGVLVPKTEVQVRAERAGLLVGRVLVEPGDSVSAGQVLTRLVQPPGATAQSLAIRAPVGGVVAGITAVIGSPASPEALEPMVRIIQDGLLELRGDVLAASLPRLRVGQQATLQIAGIGQIGGSIASIDRTVDATTQLGTVRVTVAADARLRPGVFARAELDTGDACGVAVPLSAVLFGPRGPVVQVVRGNRVETRQIEIDTFAKNVVQIRDGIRQGDMVISIAGAFVQDGDRVRPVMSGAAPVP